MEGTIPQINNVFILNPITDFTTSKLVEYLNDKFETKKTGKPFTVGDIQQYLRRGFIPKLYGHYLIEQFENKDIGVKLVRVYFNKTQNNTATKRNLNKRNKGVANKYSVSKLASILNEMYSNSSKGDFVVNTHLFGIKYADIIRKYNFNSSEIIRASILSKNYNAELAKGIKLAKYVSIKN